MDSLVEKRKRRSYNQGEKHGRAKLTEEKVREIRFRYKTERISILNLGLEYGIEYSTCRAVIQRETWKHVRELLPEDEAAPTVSTT
jgi:hypothetical protein